ncbi:NADH-quinone oxidoreductase subunit E [Aquamicrobium sp. LC103]|uniref:NADH-quinone oxidoreductase subunit E n=1 Tax=Aquamicrobium sp. LC103 TaxID=1120658 RepID=UPI00063EACBB|nr:NADH-quinone oxidoreductase subunit E [Aquamicrobium sp. LC103]TKT79077.1 NADH-quinone oxidoreductase subunit E [Aquamicrobium sp. LC103]
MSVRRLAEASVQPASFAFNRANEAWAKQTIKKYPKGREQSAVIPLLMRAQEQDGWVTKAAIEHVADMLEMPYIRVLEVATFYTQFQLKPVGTRAHIQVCGTTPCMLRGSEALMDVCKRKIHPEQFHVNEAGTLSWEEVECLGACVNAPMIMVFKDTYEDLTPERFEEMIDAFEAGGVDAVEPGPQVDRFFSAPMTGFTALVDEKSVLKSGRNDAKASAKAKEGPVAPSKSAKPKTDAPETNPAIKSPSRAKVSPAKEAAASVKAPRENGVAADKAEPTVEKADRQRKHSGKPKEAKSAFHAPETLHGEPIGADRKRLSGKAKAGGDKAQPLLSDKNRPSGIEKPAAVDDLKLISGVGPKIEGILHSLGIYTYAQVASWKKAEREWVDGYLRFHGRIEREDWIKQAKALAKGGEAEYIRVFGKTPR